MGRYYYSKKEEADSLKKIQTWFLKKHGYFSYGWRSGTITWTNGWTGNKSSVSINVNLFENDKYLQISYSQTDQDSGEKMDFNYKIVLTTTSCYLGGFRYWFMCPWYVNGVYCGRRVGVLYHGGKHFACRHCHNLSYESRNENRRYKDYALFYVIENRSKIDKLEQEIKRKTYKGKPTRKQRALNKLYAREFPYAIDIYNKGLLTK